MDHRRIHVTPYSQWRHHAIHHATSGDLDQRGHGDVSTLTVNEYLARSSGAASSTGSIATPSSCSDRSDPFRDDNRIRTPRMHPRRNHRWSATNALVAIFVASRCDRSVGRLVYFPAMYLAGRGRLAVLRPAPVRGHVLGEGAESGLRHGRGRRGSSSSSCPASSTGSPAASASITMRTTSSPQDSELPPENAHDENQMFARAKVLTMAVKGSRRFCSSCGTRIVIASCVSRT